MERQAIAKLNPGVKLPDSDIIVVHRSDGSGTSYIFTDFLNKFSRDWKDKVGNATSVNWPVGLGGKGNEGVTQQVKQTEGAIGYVELIYALSNEPPATPRSRTRPGEFVDAVARVGHRRGRERQARARTPISGSRSPTPPGDDAYPISSFTWLLVQQDMKDAAKAKADQGLPELDDHARGPADGRRSSSTPRCRRKS